MVVYINACKTISGKCFMVLIKIKINSALQKENGRLATKISLSSFLLYYT